MITRADGFLNVLDLKAALFYRVHAEEICLRTDRDNQIIVSNHRAVHPDIAHFKVYFCHFAQLECDVLLLPEDRPERVCDLRRQESRDGDLIKQRLKEVIILLVNQCDLDRDISQMACHIQAAKACPNDDNMWDVHICAPKQQNVNTGLRPFAIAIARETSGRLFAEIMALVYPTKGISIK